MKNQQSLNTETEIFIHKLFNQKFSFMIFGSFRVLFKDQDRSKQNVTADPDLLYTAVILLLFFLHSLTYSTGYLWKSAGLRRVSQ